MNTLTILVFVDGKLIKIFDSEIYSNIKYMKAHIDDYLNDMFESVKEQP